MNFIALVMLTVLPVGSEVYIPPAKMTMPYAIEEKKEIDVDTPWGKARATQYATTDLNQNIFYFFNVHNFHKTHEYDPDLLEKGILAKAQGGGRSSAYELVA